MFNTIILVVQLLQANPDMFKKADARPFQNVPLEQVAHEYELHKRHARALVAFQAEEFKSLRFELQSRFEAGSFDDQQRILGALK